MNIKSEKEFYANELKQKTERFNADIFIWGEDLVDKKLIIYPKKIKDMEEYGLIKERLQPCGVVLIDTRKSDFLHCTSAVTDIETGDIYFSEAGFNSAWKILRNSVSIGIRICTERAGVCQINQPEDIVVLDYLQRTRSTPVIKDCTIKYEARQLTEEEKYRNSRKQSLMDNPKMFYFYSDNSRYFHDKACDDVKDILSEKFQASDIMPDGKELCPKCKRKIFFRIACYPNTKQMSICDRIFKNHNVSNNRIQHYVLDVGMKFHATGYSEMYIKGVEDNWIIKGLDTDKMELWHNNYVKTSPTERYITEGYHNQKVERNTLGQLLNYIEAYSWQKHLQHEGIFVEEKVTEIFAKPANDKTNDDILIQFNEKKEKWYRRLWKILTGFFLDK